MKKLLFLLLTFVSAHGQTLVLGPGKQEFQNGPPGVKITNSDGSIEQIGKDLIGGTTVGGGLTGCTDVAGVVTCPQFVTSGVNGGLVGTEGTCLGTGFTPATGVDLLCPSSLSGPLGTHGWVQNINNGGWTNLGVVAGGASGDIQMNSGVANGLSASHFNDNGSAITSTEPVSFPVGSGAAPSINFAGHTNTGFSWVGTNSACFSGGGDTCSTHFNGGALFGELSSVFGWSSSPTNASINHDTGLTRVGPAVVAVGNGSVGDDTGILRDSNACRITSDVSLTVNVANSFCSFTIAVINKAWAWHCDILWSLTVGTGTNTFSLGVNPSQTPSATTNASANIWTTQTGTSTQGVAALSASGALNVLTSPTYTPAATLQRAEASGTIAWAAAATGTFAITATAAGTTATSAIKAGSFCALY